MISNVTYGTAIDTYDWTCGPNVVIPSTIDGEDVAFINETSFCTICWGIVSEEQKY